MAPERVKKWLPIIRALEPGSYGIELELLLAMIYQESGGDEAALRYEVAWRYFWNPKADDGLYSKDWTIEQNRTHAWNVLGSTEFHSQSFGWGLLQVMGSVARELGLKGYLAKMCDPSIGLKMGLLHMQKKMRQAKGDVRRALEFYNGSAIYAEEVLKKLADIKGEIGN